MVKKERIEWRMVYERTVQPLIEKFELKYKRIQQKINGIGMKIDRIEMNEIEYFYLHETVKKIIRLRYSK